MSWLMNRKILAVGIVALTQTLALLWMVGDRVLLLKAGREIVLPVVPVDPRDLLRGDYVTLSYEVSRVDLPPDERQTKTANQPYYVVLKKGEGEAWKAVRSSRTPPGSLAADEVLLKGRIANDWNWGGGGRWGMAHYGIEKYFVPEGTGPDLEKAAREKKLAAVIAVDSSGKAAIKGLVIDGKLRYEEPLY